MADTAPEASPAPAAAAAPAAPPEEPLQPPKRSKLLPIIVIVNVVAALVGGGFYFFSSKSASAASKKADEHEEAKPEEHAAAEPEEEPEHAEDKGGDKKPGEAARPSVRFADFVIHLRNTDADRYARASFEIEVGSDADKATLNARTPAIRDAIIAYLSDRSAEELQGSKQMAKAKEQMLESIKEIVPRAKVRAMYVTDFVVQ